jgi:membrane protease YdiL (CAAX protease family)
LPRPGKRDGLVALAALGALVLIAAATGFLASLLPGGEAAAGLEAPRTVSGWAVVLVSCAVTGYLEEGFFRAYIITRLGDIGVEGLRAVVVSVVLFSLCHLYEGPWGVVNAALAGSALSVAFIRGRSLHGPAWAHGAYNAFVYLWAL